MKRDYVHLAARNKRKSVARQGKVPPFTVVTLDIKIDFQEPSNRIKVNKGAAPTNPNARTPSNHHHHYYQWQKKARCYSNGLIGERKRLTEVKTVSLLSLPCSPIGNPSTVVHLAWKTRNAATLHFHQRQRNKMAAVWTACNAEVTKIRSLENEQRSHNKMQQHPVFTKI